MKTIILACSAGMSTSLLVTKMQDAAAARNLEVKIYAIPEATIDTEIANSTDEIKVILLGPQVRYLLDKVKAAYEPTGIFVDVIDMQLYGLMNGAGVLDKVEDKL